MQKRLLWAIAVVAGLTGCKDVDRFSTEPGESYCGKIVSASIVRYGFLDSVCIRMTFDAHRLNERPGTLWTTDGMFTDAPLRPVPQLSHDPLLTFTFGEGREKNFLFAADPTDPDRGPAVTAVISLMHAGDAEVRLFRGAALAGAPAFTADAGSGLDGAPVFGVFAPLRREQGACRAEPNCVWAPE